MSNTSFQLVEQFFERNFPNNTIVFTPSQELSNNDFISVMIFENENQAEIIKIVSEINTVFDCETTDEYVLFKIPY